MFVAWAYCSPSSSRTWKGCADGLRDSDTLLALQRGGFIDDLNEFDLSRFDKTFVGLCLCEFKFCQDPLRLLSAEQRSIRQFWHASTRWGDAALGFIAIKDACFFCPAQDGWRQLGRKQIGTSMFWLLTPQSFDRLSAQVDVTTGVSCGEYLQRWAGTFANDPRTVPSSNRQTNNSNNKAAAAQTNRNNNKKVMSMPTFHGLLVCSKVRSFLGMPIPSSKYPAFNFQPKRVVYYSTSRTRKQTRKQVPPREHRQTQQNTKQSKLPTLGMHAALSATAIWATSSTMSTSSGTTILVTPPLSLSTSRVVCWL